MKNGFGDSIDWKRFMRRGNRLLFKSRIAMGNTALGDQHYNQWYVYAHVPADLDRVVGIDRACARKFISKGHAPLTEDEVRAAALDYVLAGATTS